MAEQVRSTVSTDSEKDKASKGHLPPGRRFSRTRLKFPAEVHSEKVAAHLDLGLSQDRGRSAPTLCSL